MDNTSAYAPQKQSETTRNHRASEGAAPCETLLPDETSIVQLDLDYLDEASAFLFENSFQKVSRARVFLSEVDGDLPSELIIDEDKHAFTLRTIVPAATPQTVQAAAHVLMRMTSELFECLSVVARSLRSQRNPDVAYKVWVEDRKKG